MTQKDLNSTINKLHLKEGFNNGRWFQYETAWFWTKSNMQSFVCIMFDHSIIPIIIKPTRNIKKIVIAIDDISFNSVTTTKFKTGIMKSDILGHFPIFFVADYNIHIKELKEHYIFRCDSSEVCMKTLNYKLGTVSWGSITNSSDTNNAYDIFFEIFSLLYEEFSPKKKSKVKPRKHNNSGITNAIKKLSKRKQTLCKKFTKNNKREVIYLSKVFLKDLIFE